MQPIPELVAIITRDRPDVSTELAHTWARYLGQLKGCELASAKSPEYDYEGWLKDREEGIGGSDVAAIMGESQWSSPRQIWMSKVKMFDDIVSTQSEAARWGNVLETVIANEWALRNGKKWIHIPVSIRHTEHHWMHANIDGFILSDDETTIEGILEVKTTSVYNKEIWETGPLPFYYICQANWYCGITGVQQYTMVCLVGGQKLYDHTLPFNPDLFEREFNEAHHFWFDYVLTRTEPPATDVDAQQIAETLEVDETLPPTILEDEESENMAEAYCQIREKIRGMEKIKKALYAQLMLKIGKSTQALTSTRILTIKKTTRRSCDLDKLRELYPQAYNDCVTMNTTTSLIIR